MEPLSSIKSGMWCSITQMNEWFHNDWAGIAQIYMIRRCIKERDKERVEQVYGITNLPRSKAPASHLLELNQKHWHVENRLHYRRDVTLGEDASQLRIQRRFTHPGSLKWRHTGINGLVGRAQHGFPDASFLCPPS